MMHRRGVRTRALLTMPHLSAFQTIEPMHPPDVDQAIHSSARSCLCNLADTLAKGGLIGSLRMIMVRSTAKWQRFAGSTDRNLKASSDEVGYLSAPRCRRIFFDDFSEHLLVEGHICHQLANPAILFLELLQPADL